MMIIGQRERAICFCRITRPPLRSQCGFSTPCHMWKCPGYTTPQQKTFTLLDTWWLQCFASSAIRYSKTSDSGIVADVAGHTSRAGEFSARARELMKLYLNHMELDKDQDIRPGGEFINWDTQPSQNRRYLFRKGPR